MVLHGYFLLVLLGISMFLFRLIYEFKSMDGYNYPVNLPICLRNDTCWNECSSVNCTKSNEMNCPLYGNACFLEQSTCLSSQSMTGRQQILKKVTAHPVDSTPFNSKHQFPTNVPTEKVHPSCSSYLQSITSLLQTRSDHINDVNDWASTVALDVFYFLGAIFLLLCIYNLKRIFNKHVDDVDLQTDQERNLFINGHKLEHNHPGSSDLDLEEIENLDNESTERVLLGCHTINVNQPSNDNKESLANTKNIGGTDDHQMMQTITKNVSEMVIAELQKLGMFPTTVVGTSSRGCTDSCPEETNCAVTAPKPLLEKAIVDQWKRDKSWFVPTNTRNCAKEKAKSKLKNPLNVSGNPRPEKSTSSYQIPLDCTIQSILNNSVDVCSNEEEVVSSLYTACQTGNDSILHILHCVGADINLCAGNGISPLQLACQNGHESSTRFLLDNGANINFQMDDGATALLIACFEGRDSIVELLLHRGADKNLCMNNGVSPLFLACQNGSNSTVKILLRNKTNINLSTNNGTSPLFIACQKGFDNTVEHLLSNGANANLCIKNGVSPLYIACQNGHENVVKLLLSNGADINLCEGEGGASPLYVACREGHATIVNILLSHEAEINQCSKTGASPLYIACEKGHECIVRLLLGNNADINICKTNGVNPLFIACQNGHSSVVQILLSNRADINLCNEKGASPLFIASQNGHYKTVHHLLSFGADPNLCENSEVYALYIACQNGHDGIVENLLNHGAYFNSHNNGVSPIYIACQNGHYSTVQILLSKGADVNERQKKGISPIYIACQNGHFSIVQLLLSNGTDFNENQEKETNPLYIASQNGHDGIVDLLLGKSDLKSTTRIPCEDSDYGGMEKEEWERYSADYKTRRH